MKKVAAVFFSICLILSLFVVPISAANKAEGYAIYRDGAGLNLDWHSGFMYSSSYYSSSAVLHVDNGENGNDADTNHLINYVSLSEFEDSEPFYGYYVPMNFTSMSASAINAIKDEVLELAVELQEKTKDDLKYNLAYQVWYTTDDDNDGYVDIDEISSMRCDGYIEYCYEANNVYVYADKISIFDTSIRNDHSFTQITPKKQATFNLHNCLGDVNYDCRITAADARMVMNYSSMLETDFDRYQLFVSDVNGDGTITAADSRLIMNYSAGLITIFPADPLAS